MFLIVAQVLSELVDEVVVVEVCAADVCQRLLQEEATALVETLVAEELVAAQLTEEFLYEEALDTSSALVSARLEWLAKSRALAHELESARELEEARRVAMLKVGKRQLSGLCSEVTLLEERAGLMHGIIQHLDLSLNLACAMETPPAVHHGPKTPPPPGAGGGATLHPATPGSLHQGLAKFVGEYECEDVLCSFEDARTAAAAAARAAKRGMQRKRQRRAELEMHLKAIHEHLKGIDPKLVKVSAAKKESLAPLLRASKRLLQRKGGCVCLSLCVCILTCLCPRAPFWGIWVSGFRGFPPSLFPMVQRLALTLFVYGLLFRVYF